MSLPRDIAVPALSPADRWRSLAAVIASVFGVGVSVGAIIPLMTLVMERNGVDAAVIGLNSAMTPLAVLLVTPFLPRVVARLGTLPSMYIGLAIGVVAVLLMPLLTKSRRVVLAALPHRLRHVLAVAGQRNLDEHGRGREEPRPRHGRLRDRCSPAVSQWGRFWSASPESTASCRSSPPPPRSRSRPCRSSSLAASLPRMPEKHSLSILAVAAAAPVVMAAGVAGGTIDMAVLALLPLYGLRAGFDQEMAVMLLVLFTAGNLLLQYPIGWLADRMDRRLVLVACAGSGVVGSLILPFVLDQPPLLWTLLFIWGGTLLGIYTVGLSLLGQTTSAGALAAANAAFIVAYEIGSIAGPVTAGVAMDAIGPNGLLLLVGGVSLVFIPVVMLGRR